MLRYSHKKKFLLRIIAGALTLCSMAFIFYNSALPAKQSGELSAAVTDKVDGVINPSKPSDSSGSSDSDSGSKTDPSSPSDSEDEKAKIKEERIKKLDPKIRELAHVLEFAIFAFFAAIFAITFDMKPWIRFFAVFVSCGIYAVSDETHQYFVPGRVCDIKDVALDVTGVLVSSVAVCLAYGLYRRKVTKKADEAAEENMPTAA